MHSDPDRFPELYAAALRRHLGRTSVGRVSQAADLGCQAVVLGIGVAALARIHRRILAGAVPRAGSRQSGAARRFLVRVSLPIVEARRSRIALSRMYDTLHSRNRSLTVRNRLLLRSVGKGRGKELKESASKESGLRYADLLQQSRHLQAGLRQLTHQVLATQEDDRRDISRELQNEIAQTLLGIRIRLSSLKQAILGDAKGLQRGLASARRLVAASGRRVERVAETARKA